MVVDLSLTPENQLVRESVRDFVAAEITPHIRKWDIGGGAPREIFARMGELGFLGAPIWERWGGAGMDYVSFGILCEELEAGGHGVPRGDERPRRAQLADADAVGYPGAEATLAAPAGTRREAGDLRAHRTGRGHGRGQPRHHRAP